jgi:hypothetical protein
MLEELEAGDRYMGMAYTENNRLPNYPAAAFVSALPLSPLRQPVQEHTIGHLNTPEAAQAEELIGSMLLFIPQREGEIHSSETVRSCPFSQGRLGCSSSFASNRYGRLAATALLTSR